MKRAANTGCKRTATTKGGGAFVFAHHMRFSEWCWGDCSLYIKIRAALYMPALVAIQQEVHIKAFYEHLLAKGKKPMQAIVAVMRKLLRTIWGMLKYDQDFDGQKFYKMA